MQMAVNVVRAEEPFQAEVREVDEVPVPESRIAGDGAFGFALSAQPNQSRTAVNRLQAAGERVHLASEAFDVGEHHFLPGAFVVEAGSDTRSRVEEVARELGLQAVGLETAPPGELVALETPRLGMYMPWTGNMDEGWTRYLFHEHDFQPDTLRNADIREGDLAHYDVIVFADQGAGSILEGRRPGTMPDPYVGGVGEEGAENLRRWVEAGGTLVTFDAAGDFAIQALELPVANATSALDRADFFVPGSLIRTVFDNTHPIGFGMPPETAAFFQNSRGWEVLDPERVDVVGRYADADLLMSGWELGAQEHLAGVPAVVRVRVGEGETVLIGFRPQFRAQPTGTYRLFFNAIHGAGAQDRGALLGLRGQAAEQAVGSGSP